MTLTPRSQPQTPSRTGPDPRQQSPDRFGSSPPFETSRPLPQPPSPERPSSPSHPITTASALSRSGTLSWQNKGLSRGFGSVRGRPSPASRNPVRTQPEALRSTSPDRPEPEMSRKDIAASLSSRDPAWFRQTQDRSIGSAAYRKTSSQESDGNALSQSGMQLPGMSSRNVEARPVSPLPQPSNHIARQAPTRDVNLDGHNVLSTVRTPQLAPAAPVLMDANDSKPSDAHDVADAESMLSRSGSILGSGRPPSPTKGLGGFVQSAMMRRSDSVSKRWSVQANSGLKRGDSIASNRPMFSPPTTSTSTLGHARTLSRDPRMTRDGTSSPLSGSRPSSSHAPASGDISSTWQDQMTPQASSSPQTRPGNSSPTLPDQRPVTPPTMEPALSRSPSKTLDPRRWSPTKASWLESALSKPESPRPAPSKPDAPAWKLDMQRSKSQKDLQESPARPTSTFDPVSTGGLLRSPPPGGANKPPPLFGETLPQTKQPSLENAQSDSKTVAAPKKEERAQPSSPIVQNRQVDTAQQETPIPEPEAVKVVHSPVAPKVQTKSFSEPKLDFRSSLDKQPPALKPKPQTPPKTDFRAGLKSRQPASTDSGAAEPEFKAMFGKLKRTQTQNYKAPDVLKDNITRGKAGLSVTGGPQQTKRVDEFKESILQKKEDMKQGTGTVHKRNESDAQDKPTPDLPEALARRKTLHKAKPSTDTTTFPSTLSSRPPPEKPQVKPQALLARPSEPKPEPEPMSIPKKELEPKIPVIDNVTTKQEDKSASIVPGTKPAVLKQFSQPAKSSPKEPPRSPSPTKDNMSAKLAARLNPALANLITRGGSPKPHEGKPLSDISSNSIESRKVVQDHPEEGSGSLQHMTKARARGPKRRAPKAEAKNENEIPKPATVSIPATTEPTQGSTQVATRPDWKPKLEESSKFPNLNGSPQKAPSKPDTLPRSSPAISDVTKTTAYVDSPTPKADNLENKTRPVVASKSPELRRVSNRGPTEERPSSRPSTAGKPFDIATDETSQTKQSADFPPKDLHKPAPRALPLTPSKSKMNSPPKSADSASFESQASKVKPKPAGLGLNFADKAKKAVAADVLTPPSDSDMPSSNRTFAPVARAQQASSVTRIVQTFFGTLPNSTDRGEFDTEAFLKAQVNEVLRCKTLNHQIWEVQGDGKRIALPPGQEHILYEESMYISVHTFESDKGSKTTEAYLWAGDSVSDAAIEDAQLFYRKVARENGAKPEVVRQGMENSKFFSALGGIVIIRKSKSSALYMLCGRRHAGHVAFDEVEMSAANLCSGFPYLISAKFGKLYLWKGQGSGVDEISAAKLISMDLSLTGEIEEISEGSESAPFWESFSDPKAFKPSEMWSVRSIDQQKGFPCRLYRVEPERPKSSGGFWGLRSSSPPKSTNKMALQEISPFTQKDLDANSVHILDAYANIYV